MNSSWLHFQPVPLKPPWAPGLLHRGQSCSNKPPPSGESSSQQQTDQVMKWSHQYLSHTAERQWSNGQHNCLLCRGLGFDLRRRHYSNVYLILLGIRWQEINEIRRDELVLLSASRIKKKIFGTASMIAAPTRDLEKKLSYTKSPYWKKVVKGDGNVQAKLSTSPSRVLLFTPTPVGLWWAVSCQSHSFHLYIDFHLFCWTFLCHHYLVGFIVCVYWAGSK